MVGLVEESSPGVLIEGENDASRKCTECVTHGLTSDNSAHERLIFFGLTTMLSLARNQSLTRSVFALRSLRQM